MFRLLTAALCLALTSTAVIAKNNKNKEDKNGQEEQASEHTAAAVTIGLFSTDEKNIIRHCIGNRDGAWFNPYTPPTAQKPLPPGLQKKAASGKALPPGWQKKIARGEVLGLDAYGVATPFPYDLCSHYPSSPTGTKILQVEGKIILIMEATRMIVDAFDL